MTPGGVEINRENETRFLLSVVKSNIIDGSKGIEFIFN